MLKYTDPQMQIHCIPISLARVDDVSFESELTFQVTVKLLTPCFPKKEKMQQKMFMYSVLTDNLFVHNNPVRMKENSLIIHGNSVWSFCLLLL